MTFHRHGVWAKAVAFAALSFFACVAAAQDVTLPREYDKVVKSAEVVGSLGTDLFGDQTSFYTGTAEFTVTDVSLPGIGQVPVSLTRRYVVEDKVGVYGGVNTGKPVYVFGDWQLDIPHLHGVFARQGASLGGWLSSNADLSQRCTVANTNMAKPPLAYGPQGGTFAPSEYWHGNSLHVPGGGDQEMLVIVPENTHKPTDGKTYRWVTPGQWYFSCLPATANGAPGEGFLAIDPNGTRYWFDWIVSWPTQQVTKPPFAPAVEPVSKAAALPADDSEPTPRAYISAFLRRNKVSIYPTKIQDRFGNTVTYAYDATVKTRLLSVSASDGRKLTLGYNPDGRVQSVSDGVRTWGYTYSGGTKLTTVTLPDNSQWKYSLTALESLYADTSLVDESSCTSLPMNPTQVARTGSITHPSGAVGTFTFKPTLHGRSYTNLNCVLSDDGQGNFFSFSIYPYLFSSLSLQSKKIEGPGLPTGGYTWAYTYGPPNNSQANCNGCPDTKTVTVTGPGEWVRYTFSNKFQAGEGKLVKTETGASANSILRTETTAYQLNPAGQLYPARIGASPFTRSDRTAEKHAPMLQRQISQQGTTFTWQMNQTNGVYAFDAYANPLSVTRSSSLAYNKTDVTEYNNNAGKWVIGQVQKLTTNGIEVSRADYHPVTALPTATYKFNKPQYTVAYYTDGSLRQLTDGNNHTTTFANWKRGIPQKITFADGKFKLAVVNNLGQIASVNDENGYTTQYGYDAMGRLSLIDYPDGDTVNWANTTRSFVPVAGSEYGIAPGHWKQTVSTGNGRQDTYYDALWRPMVVATYELGNSGNTLSQSVTRYDAQGRPTFVSYPQRENNAAVYTTWGNPAVAPNATGSDTTYDALGRVLTTKADSELGTLTTSYEYLTGLQTRVTHPRGHKTTTTYLAYDQPTTDWPMHITHPEGAYTRFVRDVFGKPTALTRHNADNSDWNTRYFAYDANQQLCKTTEVETGTTAYGYDAAGNLTWSAAALPWSPAAPCEYTANDTWVSPRRVDRTYDARNRLVTLSFPDGLGDQAWTYTPDGLPDTITAYNGPGHTAPVITAYAYNQRRLLSGQGETITQPDWYSWGIGYGYNTNGHLASHAYPSWLTVTYAPNALGQPTRVGTYATDVSYHPNGGIKQFTYGNGLVHTLTQNVRGLPDTSCDFTGTCTAAAALNDGYDYDANGNVAAISDGRTLNRGNRTMTYDGLDRLRTVASPMYGAQGAAYAYDTLDNLTRVRIGGTATRDHWYCYDAHNQLTNVKTGGCNGTSVMGLGFDERGNLANKNGQTYAFDYGNRLRSATGLEHYRYDGLGRRAMAWHPTLGSIFSQYSRDGRLMYQNDDRRDVRIDYLYLGGSLVASREHDIQTNLYTTKYQHTDALGSPVAVTDANRVVIEKSEYEPYGLLINRPLKDGPGFTGHVSDAATGLSHMQQRYYWPGGIFLSVDPVTVDSVGGNFHRYWYANNNPYTFKDPDGRLGVVGALIGAGIEFGMQMATAEGSFKQRLSQVDVTDIVVAGAVGAVTGGVGGRLATNAAKGLISTARAVKTTAAVGAAASTAGSATQSALNGEAPDPGKMAISGVMGGLSSGAGAKLGNAGVARLEKLLISNSPGAPNIAQTTLNTLTGRAAEATTSSAQQAGQVAVDAAASAAQNVSERKLEERRSK